jgi:hypothetical protein
MTKLVILSQTERRRFDSPPMFNANERALYFSLNNTDLQTVQELRTATNKVGFVLQLCTPAWLLQITGEIFHC